MSDRMTDERLAALSTFGPYPYHAHLELHAGMVAERAEAERLEARVVRLETALTDLYVAFGLHAVGPKRHAAVEQAVAVLAEGATT